MDGWRIDVGYPEDRDEAERRLREEHGDTEAATDADGDPDSEAEAAGASPDE